jgi:type II secretory pathway pseudopilin PulG
MRKKSQITSSAKTAGKGMKRPALLQSLMARLHGVGGEAFVVMVGDEGAVLSYVKNNKVERRLFSISPDPQHARAMTDMLNAAKNIPVFVLLDVLDQQYIRQSFPPVSALSLNKIVQRRLDRDLLADDIKGALPLGREDAGRREWNYMLVAVSNTPDLQSWLELLMECKNQFKGVYLVPIESLNLIEDLQRADAQMRKHAAPWQILFLHTKVGGFRQVVLHEGNLVFTRLSQVTDESNNAFVAGTVEQELQNTLDYLRRFDLEDNQHVQCFVVVAPDVKEQVDMKRFGFSDYMLLTPHEVGEKLGLNNAALYADTYSDIIVSHAFLRHLPIKKLMPHYGKPLMKLQASIKAVRFATIAVLALFAFLIAQTLWGYFANLNQSENLRASQQQLQLKLNKLTALVEGQADNVKLANSVTALWNNKKLGDVVPLDFVRELTLHLPEDVRITSIDWKKITINRATSRVRGPSDMQVKVGVDFTGSYPDDVAYAQVAHAFYEQLRRNMPRYEINASGLPGSDGGTAQLEIDFNKGKQSAERDKKRSVLFTFKGFVAGKPRR